MKTNAVIAVLASILALTQPGCSRKQAVTGTAPEESLTVAGICSDPARYDGQTVTLDAAFQGFRVAECRFPETASQTSITRSDWLVRTGQDCLLVTGPAPEGVDLFDPAHVGRRLELKARVFRDESGKVHMEALESRFLPQ